MDGLKQRVVGALVIVSLAVIFLPMIFDKPHQKTKTQLIPIPVQPELPVITLKTPQKPSFKIVEPSEGDSVAVAVEDSSVVSSENESGSQAANTKPDVVSSKPETGLLSTEADLTEAAPKSSDNTQTQQKSPVITSNKPKPVFKEKELSDVWMVQLGTFGNHKNAYALRDTLRKKGFDGHTKKIDRDGTEMVRVFSGPYADKGYADKIKKQLDKQFKLNSLVVHFK
ncbi:SPOR domain-containing protein [Alkalimarinus coralli]|uniref:SPOR domain-containing protein n=1 Tax=Alkalimarinus coralli TaxID=2935863 RepID=UPI00202B0B7C|nr:SPOR domain-containing protein [Alkalimarinus coralli]